MKRTRAGEVRNVSLPVASAVNKDGYREIPGICEGAKEDRSGRSSFLRHLADRGFKGVQLIISDACRGLVESMPRVFAGSTLAMLYGAFLSQSVFPCFINESTGSFSYVESCSCCGAG